MSLLFPLGRAHRHFLGLRAKGVPDSDDHATPLDTVRLSPQAAQCFRSQLSVPGTFRSGPLFGHREGSILHVVYAAPGGYLRWADHDPTQPFFLDPGYVLGWTDALRTMHPEPIDWVGTWLGFPTTVAADQDREQPLLQQARRELLAEDSAALLFIGWNRNEVEVHGYGSVASSQGRPLTVEWMPGTPSYAGEVGNRARSG